jgi:alanyl-tRNA synthetase
MKSTEIRSKFLEFFRKRGHAIIPSASLITTDEKGVTNPTLFNTAGMQPLIPYLLGKKHPEGKRLADSQKCLRTVDIDDIGDKTHATFFEMLGNWSLGDYFKEDAIKWSFEFLTNKEEGLGLDPKRLYVTVFEGDENAPKDTEAFEIWKKYVPEHRIYFMSAKSNWWEAGDSGPCGPDSEMFYDVTKEGIGDMTKDQYITADERRDVVEIWNDVFMQYEKKDGKIVGKLPAPSVDTGAGLERLAMVMQGVDNIYDTDLLKPVIKAVQGDVEYEMDLTISKDERKRVFDIKTKSERIIADHIRASVMMIADGITPSNTDRGYVLRKLIRRSVRHSDLLFRVNLPEVIKAVQDNYRDIYPNVVNQDDGLTIQKIIREEENKFRETLRLGLKEFEKGTDAFTLFSSYGFPLELTLELAKEKGITIDIDEFNEKFKKHQELSRSGAEQKFKGGLADANDEMVVRYHTATHLLHQALFDVLGDKVMQKGSNITGERLRFDFAHGAKMTDDEKKKVEDIVNEKIAQKLPMNNVIMSREEAEKTGAKHFFGEKYGDEISIYFIGNDLASAYSKEFCGGPHVKNTSELAGPEGKWKFKIQKEEAVSAGVRRIKAVLG